MAGLLSLVGSTMGGSGGGFLKDDGAYVYIVPYTTDGKPDADNMRSFQFWPAEVTDNYAINYASKQIPGSNLPFYQWINGGEHVVSFTATFAADLYFQSGDAAKLGKEDKHTVDVAAAVKWLRWLCSPDYPRGKDFAQEPPFLNLVCPRTPIGMDLSDRMNCIMTQCGVTWKKWFPDGTPRLAEVSLSFAETVQIPQGLQFYGRSHTTSWQKRYGFKRGADADPGGK